MWFWNKKPKIPTELDKLIALVKAGKCEVRKFGNYCFNITGHNPYFDLYLDNGIWIYGYWFRTLRTEDKDNVLVRGNVKLNPLFKACKEHLRSKRGLENVHLHYDMMIEERQQTIESEGKELINKL